MSQRALLRADAGPNRRLLRSTIALHGFLMPCLLLDWPVLPIGCHYHRPRLRSRAVTSLGSVVSCGIAVSALKPSSAADLADIVIRDFLEADLN